MVNGHLEIVIRDRGAGMSPRPDSPGLGVGLAIAAQAADEMRVIALSGGGAEIILTFR
jgi:anti-sigma regulatory factor (Ser/Thr protein kinase)